MPSSYLILWRPLLLLLSVFPNVRDLSNEPTVHIRWTKYWSFSFSISPSNEYLGLISLKFDWFDLLAVQGTLRSLLQHHSSKASILWCSAFFMVQLSQVHVTTGKNIALTIWTFVDRVMSLLFNTLSRFVIAFLPRSKGLLISWLQLPSGVILEPKKRKSVSTSTFPPSICHEVMGLDAMILVFFIFSFKPALSLLCWVISLSNDGIKDRSRGWGFDRTTDDACVTASRKPGCGGLEKDRWMDVGRGQFAEFLC